MRIGFSHYKSEKTSSSTVVLPSPPLPSSLFFRLHLSACPLHPHSFSIFTSRARSLSLLPPLPHRHRLRGRMAACQLQLAIAAAYLRRKGKKKKRREEKKRREALGEQVRSKEWKGMGGDRKTVGRNEIRARHFRPVKPITTTFFARSITRNRVNCKLTRRVSRRRSRI